MYIVTNMAAFCSSLISYYPSTLLMCCLNDFGMVPLALIIIYLFKFIALGAFAKLWKATISFVMSVRLSVFPPVRPCEWVPTGRIFMKDDVWGFFENLLRKFNFHENRARIKGSLRPIHILVACRTVLLRMRHVSGKKLWRKSKHAFRVQ